MWTGAREQFGITQQHGGCRPGVRPVHHATASGELRELGLNVTLRVDDPVKGQPLQRGPLSLRQLTGPMFEHRQRRLQEDSLDGELRPRPNAISLGAPIESMLTNGCLFASHSACFGTLKPSSGTPTFPADPIRLACCWDSVSRP